MRALSAIMLVVAALVIYNLIVNALVAVMSVVLIGFLVSVLLKLK